MSRKHVIFVTLLLGAVFVAGLGAVSRTVALGQPAKASTSADPAIAFRLAKLDRFEASLERRAASLKTRPAAAPVTVYRRAPSVQTAPAAHRGEREAEHDEASDD